MRKLTTITALVLALSLAAPAVTSAAGTYAAKTKSSSVREDDGPRDGDVISRIFRFIVSHLHLTINDDASPIIPTP